MKDYVENLLKTVSGQSLDGLSDEAKQAIDLLNKASDTRNETSIASITGTESPEDQWVFINALNELIEKGFENDIVTFSGNTTWVLSRVKDAIDEDSELAMQIKSELFEVISCAPVQNELHKKILNHYAQKTNPACMADYNLEQDAEACGCTKEELIEALTHLAEKDKFIGEYISMSKDSPSLLCYGFREEHIENMVKGAILAD